jgi:hypothetical protein
MPPLKHIIPLALLLLLAAGCGDDNDDNQIDELVPLQVGLLNGFGGHAVRIEFFEEEVYSDTLPESVYPWEPLAGFSVIRPRGANQINVYWQDLDSLYGYWENYLFNLGNADQYYMSIGPTAPGSITVVLQDRPIPYPE